MTTEAMEAHFFPQESSSTHRNGWTPILCVELDSCEKKWASVASVDDIKSSDKFAILVI